MIKFNEPLCDNDEFECIHDALSGADYTDKALNSLIEYFDRDNIFLTCNGSSAIEMAFALMDLPKGSEVILPSFNYPSIGNTILRYGLKPVFVDVDIDHVILSMDKVKEAVTDKTKCIVPVHYGGRTMDMDALNTFASKKGIIVIEDAALSFDAEYKGNKLGTLSQMAIMSFHETKNVSCGTGGMLIINNEELMERASLIYNNGTDKEDFINGKVKMYSWKAMGMNAAMTNVHAAMLYAQLKKKDVIANKRKKIYDYYNEKLDEVSEKYNLILPKLNEDNKENHHVYYVIFESNEIREKVRLHLKSKDIQAHTHYVPLHLSDMGKSLGYSDGNLPNTEDVFKRLLRLPLHNKMTIDDAKKVVDTVLEVL